MWHTGPAAFAAWSPTAQVGHLGRQAGLVDEYEALRIEVGLGLEPILPPLQDIEAILLLRMGGPYGMARPSPSAHVQCWNKRRVP